MQADLRVVRGERVVFGARRTVRGSIVEWEGRGEVGWSFWRWVKGERIEDEGSVEGGRAARWSEVERRREGLSTRRRSGEGEEGGGGGWM